MGFVLDAYAARSCPVKTFNAFSPHLESPPVPLDESLPEQFQGGRDFRRQVMDVVAARADGAVDLRELENAHDSFTERETATLQALEAGAPIVISAVLPSDLDQHRSGRADLLVRGDDAPGGGPGYWPARVKPYRVLERQSGATHLQQSSLAAPRELEVLPGQRYRVFREGALLEVAHLWRMLESLGFAAATPLGGVVGNAGDAEALVTWVDLTHRFIRTFSRTSPSGHRLRSPLERYDHEHGFRVHVAEVAAAGTAHADAPVRPIRVRECESCAWWESCRPRMDADDLSLRLSKTPLDVRELQTLLGLGIQTIDDLAMADIDALLPAYLPLTTHRDRSEQRLRQAARRARMMKRGVSLERFTHEPISIPRSEVEVDLDIETADGDITYLWGALVTDRRTGSQHYEHFSEFSDLDPAAEVELAARFSRWLLGMVEEHPTLKVYHYSDYETVHLRRLAQRGQHPDLLAAVDLIEGHFVDLFRDVRENFVGVEGLGLKVVATQGAGFRWRDEEPGGLASQTWFATAVHAEDPAERDAARTRVLEYNEDDVLATWAVREWMATTSPSDA